MARLPHGYVATGTYRRGGALVHLALEDRHGGREVMLLAEPVPARAGAAVPDYQHPGLPEVVEGVQDGETRWLVLVMPPGIPLDRLLEGGVLTEDQALAVAAQLASALEHLHRLPRPYAMGVLSPRWVRVDERGRVCLNFLAVDPGAPADDAQADPRHGAPEMASGGAPGPLCDIYSLGKVLGAATGLDHPVRRRLQGGPMAGIITLATHADPRQRFASMAAVRAALEQRQAELAFRRADQVAEPSSSAAGHTDSARAALLASGVTRQALPQADTDPGWAAVTPPQPVRRTRGVGTRVTRHRQRPGIVRATGKGMVLVAGAVGRGVSVMWMGAADRLTGWFDYLWGHDRRRGRKRRRRRFFLTDPANLPLLILIAVLGLLALAMLFTIPPTSGTAV